MNDGFTVIIKEEIPINVTIKSEVFKTDIDVPVIQLPTDLTPYALKTFVEAEVAKIPEFITIRKLADEIRTNTNVYTDDSELKDIELDINSWYRFELIIITKCHATPDMKMRVNRTGLSDAILQYAGDLDLSSAPILTWTSGNVIAGTTNVERMGNFIGYIRTGTDPGSISIQWAQNALDAVNPAQMSADSCIFLRKIT